MARWHFCNVLEVGPDARRVWQFDAQKFQLSREQTSTNGAPLPSGLVGKSWGSLWRKKLNVAWLPPENVFIRVAQFPQSTFDETRSMVDLQLEKLSPIPVTQAVWTMHVLPHPGGNMQTVIVTIAERSAVEEFLGKLESQGFLADRLELPMLDQLQPGMAHDDGAWIYAEAGGGPNTALVAWWLGGVLQNLDLLTLPEGADRAAAMHDQLVQMAWAGELEGWLTGPPRWHLVADTARADVWEPALREGLGQPISVVAPLPETEIAARTARRATAADENLNLLPPEFRERYRQKLIDRLYMRGLLALVGLYLVGIAIYFVAVTFLNYNTAKIEEQVMQESLTYTNAIETLDLYDTLKERQALRFAAMDCWEAVAELLPEGITLETMNFKEGKHLTLAGTVPANQVTDLIDFSAKLAKYNLPARNDEPAQPLFDAGSLVPPATHAMGDTYSWNFDLTLKRGGD
jgi:hypothetical protein